MKKVITNLEFLKLHNIPVVILINCELQFWNILAEILNMGLKESWFPDLGKVSCIVPVFIYLFILEASFMPRNCCPVSVISVVIKIFETLVNRILVDHLEKCCPFLISSMVSCLLHIWSIFCSGDQIFLIRSSHRWICWISMAFNRYGDNWAVALTFLKLSTGVIMLAFLTDLSVLEFQVRYLAFFHFFAVIDSCAWFQIRSIHKSIKLMLGFLKAVFLVEHFSYYNLIIFLLIIAIHA